ncbi:hypothetical protein GCM10010329_62730 [Streptomyces spiroverticillatus]|nr:hypothetical protein GCM10010329_62730 [Streptomyces spiroverticillatus]
MSTTWSAGRNRRDGNDRRAWAAWVACTCGWAREARPLGWEQIGATSLREGGEEVADACLEDWDQHLQAVERAAVPTCPRI